MTAGEPEVEEPSVQVDKSMFVIRDALQPNKTLLGQKHSRLWLQQTKQDQLESTAQVRAECELCNGSLLHWNISARMQRTIPVNIHIIYASVITAALVPGGVRIYTLSFVTKLFHHCSPEIIMKLFRENDEITLILPVSKLKCVQICPPLRRAH